MCKRNKKEVLKTAAASGLGFALVYAALSEKEKLDDRYNRGENPLDYIDDLERVGAAWVSGAYLCAHYGKRFVNAVSCKKVFK